MPRKLTPRESTVVALLALSGCVFSTPLTDAGTDAGTESDAGARIGSCFHNTPDTDGTAWLPKNAGVAPANCHPPLKSYSVFRDHAWGAEIAPSRDVMAFNRQDSDNLYHLYIVNLDGGSEVRFGVDTPHFPQKTTGSPSFHPSGKYLAFVAEKPMHPGASNAATPGWGSYSDIWVISANREFICQLTDVPIDTEHGVLIPIFSPDGTKMMWTERTVSANIFNPRQAFGYWVLKTADFFEDPVNGPYLQNVRTIDPDPSEGSFNESGGFTADNQTLVFTSDFTSKNAWNNQIMVQNVVTKAFTSLTDVTTYNEHPRVTPTGDIMWMSNIDSTLKGEDWWVMHADGSGKTRVSYFNNPDHGFNDSVGGINNGSLVTTGPVPAANWTEDRRAFYGDVQTNILTADGKIIRAELTCDP